MDFENPDHRKFVTVMMAACVFFLFVAAVWAESEKMAITGGIMMPGLIALGIWTGIGYDEESPDEKAARKKAKRKSRAEVI